MKGIVFTELVEMVTKMKSEDFVDDWIDSCDLPSGGAYTAVGTYPHQEAVTLVVRLSELTGISVPDLLKAFGRYLFERFTILYPAFFQNITNTIDFLSGIENVIHAEVLKLYPDAQLPKFDAVRPKDGVLELTYHSDKHLADLAEGLLEGCIQHFGVPHSVDRSLPSPDGAVVFTVSRAL